MTDHGEAPLPTSELIAERAAAINDRIVQAGGAGRVTLLPVTKGFGPDLCRAAAVAGLKVFGENYAQDLAGKASTLASEGLAVSWHMIGSVQRNKVRAIADAVDLWQTMDRPALVDEVAKRASGAQVLIQVNTTGEQQKAGCAPSEVESLLSHAIDRGLWVKGLMTVGPTDASVDPRPAFQTLVRLADSLALPIRSMGMSGDLDTAVSEGSTMVRVGRGLFGPRPARVDMTD